MDATAFAGGFAAAGGGGLKQRIDDLDTTKLQEKVQKFDEHVKALRSFLEHFVDVALAQQIQKQTADAQPNGEGHAAASAPTPENEPRRSTRRSARRGASSAGEEDRMQQQMDEQDTAGASVSARKQRLLLRPEATLWAGLKYRQMLQEVFERRRRYLPIFLDDVQDYFVHGVGVGDGADDGVGNDAPEKSGSLGKSDASVHVGLMTNTSRYMELLYEAVCQSLAEDAMEYETRKLKREEIIEERRQRKAAALLRKRRRRRANEKRMDTVQEEGSTQSEEDSMEDEEGERVVDGVGDENLEVGSDDLSDAEGDASSSSSTRLLGLGPNRVDKDENYDSWESLRQRDMASRRVPAVLRAPFQIVIIPSTTEAPRRFRAVDADCIGHLVRFEANVVRVTQVKPRLQVAAFECERCHDKVFQAIEGPMFMPMSACPNCIRAAAGGPGGRTPATTSLGTDTLKFHQKLSKFTPYQEVRVEEPAIQVPEADVPRALTCLAMGCHTKNMQPGMAVTLTGILRPVTKTGFAALRAGPIQEKCFEVLHIGNNKDAASEWVERQQQEKHIREQVETLKQTEGLYDKLANSIAPGVWGLEDVKKALLLQLIGGVTTVKPDGGMIRGDIHVMLMGDPGVAKSQLMKQICAVASRSVYTTGKGSSSCGLTAAVVKDPNTGETTLEGGALVLADRGICCIDEFDKMDEYDRSAIYEVMEQQTVSIAKAGHCSSLAARAAVLAAANPRDGRYDIRKSILANMNLPAALLSRFDLQFLLLDRAEREKDIKMASHVLQSYRNAGSGQSDGSSATMGGGSQKKGGSSSSATASSRTGRRVVGSSKKQTRRGRRSGAGRGDDDNDEMDDDDDDDDNNNEIEFVSKEVLRAFIQDARRVNPSLQEELKPAVVDWFVSTRQEEQQEERTSGLLSSYTTARALLGVLRLSQALARLRGSPVIETPDFEEGLRLIEASKESVRSAAAAKSRRVDRSGDIFNLLKRIRARLVTAKGASWDGYIRVKELENQAFAQGLSAADVARALGQYEELTAIIFNKARTKIGFPDDAGNPQESDDEEEDDE